MQKAGFFPREFLDELKIASNIITVASRYMPLRARGRQHWGLCPFHHEKTPSFAINEQQQYFKCFGCGESGNVITLVRQLESVDFNEAVELLAKWANITIPTAKIDPEYLVKRKKKERTLDVLEEARKFYYTNLGKDARAYLNNRGITDELIEKFSLGESNTWEGVLDHLKKRGFTEPEIIDAGVASKSERGKVYDAMAERITFPIFDIFGNCIGFTGRTLSNEKSVAKYRNTAQTAVFDKSSIVYGVDVLKREKRSGGDMAGLIVVEGNVDVISLVGAGFTNTLASMGTALTQFHARIFSRFSPNIYLCFDGDDSGQKAALRAVDILAGEGLNVRVIELPKDTDPDSFVTKNGKDAFEKLVRNAKPYIDFKLDYLEKISNLDDNIGKAEYLKRAGTILSTLGNTPEVELYLAKVSKLSGVSIDGVKRTLGSAPDKQLHVARPEVKLSNNAERMVIATFLNGIEKITDINLQFSTRLYAELYGIMSDCREWRLGNLELDDFAEEDRKTIIEILELTHDELKRNFPNAFKQMKKSHASKRITELQRLYDATDDLKVRAEYSKEIAKILKEKHA
ncbi:MAG: DNA primase [Firmicutes bacterium]|nr:DNA primase [Bacillota bacterium]